MLEPWKVVFWFCLEDQIQIAEHIRTKCLTQGSKSTGVVYLTVIQAKEAKLGQSKGNHVNLQEGKEQSKVNWVKTNWVSWYESKPISSNTNFTIEMHDSFFLLIKIGHAQNIISPRPPPDRERIGNLYTHVTIHQVNAYIPLTWCE